MAPDKTPTTPHPDQYWLLWDGACGFCRRSVDWIVARDTTKRLLPTPYQQVPNPPMDSALATACERAVHLMHPDGRIERAGRACLTALELTGYAPVLMRIMRVPPLIWLLEIGYWLTARNRSFFSRFFFR